MLYPCVNPKLIVFPEILEGDGVNALEKECRSPATFSLTKSIAAPAGVSESWNVLSVAEVM